MVKLTTADLVQKVENSKWVLKVGRFINKMYHVHV